MLCCCNPPPWTPSVPWKAPPSLPESLPAHCSPSTLNLLPFCQCCLPSTHPSYYMVWVPTPIHCPPQVSHTLSAQCIWQENTSFARCLMKVEMETKAPHACACSSTRTKVKGVLMGNRRAHSLTVSNSPTFANQIEAVPMAEVVHKQMTKEPEICLCHSHLMMCVHCPRTEKACMSALACQD